MEQIQEEPANQEAGLETRAANQHGHEIIPPEFERSTPVHGQESQLAPSGNKLTASRESMGKRVDWSFDEDVGFEHGHSKGTEWKDVATSPTHGERRKPSANGSGQGQRPKSRQSPPAGKYLVRDLEEQKRLFEQPSHRPPRGVEKNQQTD